MLHDIRIETLTDGLYQALLKKRKPHEKNKQIVLEIPNIDSRFKTKVSISQNGRLLVMLACTQKPLPYSILGFDELIEYLTKLANHLMLYSDYDFVYGRTGSVQVNSLIVCVKFEHQIISDRNIDIHSIVDIPGTGRLKNNRRNIDRIHINTALLRRRQIQGIDDCQFGTGFNRRKI